MSTFENFWKFEDERISKKANDHLAMSRYEILLVVIGRLAIRKINQQIGIGKLLE